MHKMNPDSYVTLGLLRSTYLSPSIVNLEERRGKSHPPYCSQTNPKDPKASKGDHHNSDAISESTFKAARNG